MPGTGRGGSRQALMRRIDALFMAWPFLDSRRLTTMLRALRMVRCLRKIHHRPNATTLLYGITILDRRALRE